MLGLRAFSKSDAEVILSWITDEKSFRQWSADKYKNYPADVVEVNSFYEEIKAQGGKVFMFCDDDKAIGHFVMRPLQDEEVKTVRFGFIVVDSTIRGKGYGRLMLTEALKYASEIYGASRVTLGVFENNPKALKCYESLGFTKWGESVYNIGPEKWKCLEMERVF